MDRFLILSAHQMSHHVTIEQRDCATTIDEQPQCIVSLDMAWTDVLLDMGQPPVGYLADHNIPEGVPWALEQIRPKLEIAAG